MSKIKELTDAYLRKHYQKVQDLKDTGKIKWSDVAKEISYQGSHRELPDPEYVRKRFLQLKKAVSIGSAIGKSNEVFKETFKTAQELFNKEISKFQYSSGKENKEQGTKEFYFTADTIPTEDEIIEHFNIDIKKFKISQIWHKTTPSGKYSISVNLQALKGNQVIELDEAFIEKLNSIKPIGLSSVSKELSSIKKNKACLLIPKQDVHWNKYDVDGKNSIEDRFKSFTKTILNQLEKAQATNTLEKIVYIVGSDEFNSEYTNATTKGTPQQNILSYQEAFEKVTEFTIEFIKLLRFYTPNVEVVLLNGNHDHNVSWHLANLLKHVFSKNEAVSVNTELVNTKILEYSSNLILINHGDEMKPKDLATKFPIIAKNKWSSFDNYFVITGDKHHEVAHDFNGVRTYQVPQLSTAKSAWDDKKGHSCSKAESVLFLFEEDGLSAILRKTII
jgi:hypothetical protein